MKCIRIGLFVLAAFVVSSGLAHALTITGTLNGCGIGQGTWSCSITTANGNNYYISAPADGTEGFGNLNTTTEVFEKIDIENWKGKIVEVKGEINQDGELIEVDSVKLKK